MGEEHEVKSWSEMWLESVENEGCLINRDDCEVILQPEKTSPKKRTVENSPILKELAESKKAVGVDHKPEDEKRWTDENIKKAMIYAWKTTPCFGVVGLTPEKIMNSYLQSLKTQPTPSNSKEVK